MFTTFPRKRRRRKRDDGCEKVEGGYLFRFQAEAELACFARSDCSDMPVTSLVPGPAPLRGIVENTLHLENAFVTILSVGICSPLFTERFTINNTGVFRDRVYANEQCRMIVLRKPCYQVTALVSAYKHASPFLSEKARGYVEGRQNGAHSFAAQWNRRLAKGQYYRPRFMGIADFPLTYMGPWKDTTRVCEEIEMTISFLNGEHFSRGHHGTFQPARPIQAIIKKGVMTYVAV